MTTSLPTLSICLLILVVASCSGPKEKVSFPGEESQQPAQVAQEAVYKKKIKFDLDSIDEQGLIGPADGKRALDYEFKIPKLPGYRKEVRGIDPSVKFMPGSRGRIGANEDEILCIGSTDQPRYREILLNLAALPYIDRIIVCYFE